MADSVSFFQRPKTKEIIDALGTPVAQQPARVGEANIGLVVADNKSYFVKQVHQHADDVDDRGEFLHTVNWFEVDFDPTGLPTFNFDPASGNNNI